MDDLRRYSADETLRDGGTVHIRAIRPSDKERLREHSTHLSTRSVYFRFLGPKKRLTDKDLTLFTDLDFVNRVALVVTLGRGEDEKIIGVGRYAIVSNEGDPVRSAELGFTVIDEHQKRGIGSLLLQHLMKIGRRQEIHQFEAEVLADNKAMLTVFAKSGVAARKTVSSGVVHLVFPITACGSSPSCVQSLAPGRIGEGG